MKITKSLNITILALLGLGLASLGQAQVYQFTAPIIGCQYACVFDLGVLAGTPVAYGELSFGTLSETVYYDPVASTLREVGSFSISPTSLTAGVEDDRYTASGALVPAYLSATYTFNGGNNTVSFDTGVHPLLDEGQGVFSFRGGFMNWEIPFTASWALTTSGQEYYGEFSGNYYMMDYMASDYISQITPTSLVIQQGDPSVGFWPDDYHQFEDTTINANGITYDISDEYFDKTMDQEFYVAPVTAIAVPEPASLSLLAVGMFGITLLRRHQR